MRTIGVVNQKGGCGKTTTAINVAAAFAERDKRVLLVDFDPQAHATIGVGRDPDTFDRTIYDVLVDPGVPLSEVIIHSETEGLDLAPSNVRLAIAELELAAAPDKDVRLARKLQAVRDSYDLAVIDSPASLGLLTLNTLVTSSDVIIPVQVHYYALEGLKRLLETIRFVQEHLNPYSMESVRLLLTFVEDRTKFTRQVREQVQGVFADLVLDTVIHNDIRLAEAPGAGESVLSYATRSRGASDYRALASEILSVLPQSKSAAVERIRTGLHEHLATLFRGAWLPRKARSAGSGSMDAA